MDQPAAINPYVKLSRRFGRQRLAALSTTRALNVLVYFWCEQEPDGTVMASYDQIMQATGIKSSSTIAAALTRLDACGFITRLGNDIEVGVGCFRLLEDWTRYKSGAPSGMGLTSETGEGASSLFEVPPIGSSESEDPLSSEIEDLVKENLVVVVDQESKQQQPDLNRSSKTEEPSTSASSEIEVPAQTPLDVALQEGFLQRQGGDGAPSPLAVQSVEELVERYGEEAVLEGLAISVRQNKRTLAYLNGVLRNRAPLRAFYEEAQNGDQRPARPAPPAPSEGELLWAEACADLRVQLPHETFDTWLRNARLLDHTDGLFTVGVGNARAVEWLEAGRLKGVVTRALRQVAGESAEVHFVIDEGT
jgi:hypothetical protein